MGIRRPRLIPVTDRLCLSALPSKRAYAQQLAVLLLKSSRVSLLVTAVEDRELIKANGFEYLAAVRDAGISIIRCATPDMQTPKIADVLRVISLVEQEIRRGGRVAFQCFEALGRAPCFLSAYLVSTGVDPEAAVRLIREVEPHSFLTLDQMKFPLKIGHHLRQFPRAVTWSRSDELPPLDRAVSAYPLP